MKRDYPINILMVDDHPENLLAIEAVLENEPYRLIRALSGPDALRCLLRDEIAVILLDVQMPGMDGFETAKHIKAYDKSKHIPIIFITATSKEKEHLYSGYSAGALDYMVKPFIPQILKSKIQGFVSIYDAQKVLKQQTSQLEATNRDLMETTKQLIAAEAQARIVMETSIDTMLIFTQEGMILNSNPAAVGMFGYTQDELRGQNISLLLPFLGLEEQTPFHNWTGKVIEVSPQRKDNSTFMAELQLGESCEGTRLLACTVRDISARKQAEQELVRAKEIAEEASQVKSDFLSFMSHEIRTPLNGIIGIMDILMDSDLTDEQKELASVASKSGDTLLSIINNILDFSKMNAGRLDLGKEPFVLAPCLEQVRDILIAKILDKQIEWVMVIDPELPDVLIGDAARLQQVLLNLIGNAVKFTDAAGAVYVVVSKLRESEHSITIEFVVKDTGIGIPSEKLNGLFQPFSQVDASITRKYGGSGLGLAICKNLVELMGGAIRVEQSEDIGAVFVFTIEAGVGSAADDAVQEMLYVQQRLLTPPSHRCAPLHILIAEHVRLNQQLLVHMLHAFGCTTDVVADGAEALQALETKRYDLVYAEIDLPGMGGSELAQLIINRWSPTERPLLIALTAERHLSDELWYVRAGFDKVIIKPFRSASLKDSLLMNSKIID